MRRLFIILFIVVSCSGMHLMAQDYSFSNHNTVPFTLNPSLVGNANAIRFGLNYRQQWPALGNKYHTVRASYDQNFYKQMCSLGFAYSYDNMASGTYQVNEFDLVYSHTIRLQDHYFIRMGVEGTLFANYMGDNMEFADQYDPYYRNVSKPTLEDIENDSRAFFDFSAGAAFAIENHLTVGVSVFHIGEPKNGFLDRPDNVLNRKFVLHGSYFIDLQYKNGLFGRSDLSSNYLFINAYFQKQADFNQVYGGVGLLFSPVIVGVSLKYDLEEVYTPSFMAGVQFGEFQACYIYDIFTSRSKQNGSWSHELDLIYIIRVKERYPCPVVYW